LEKRKYVDRNRKRDARGRKVNRDYNMNKKRKRNS
jgi:hypothetical protein